MRIGLLNIHQNLKYTRAILAALSFFLIIPEGNCEFASGEGGGVEQPSIGLESINTTCEECQPSIQRFSGQIEFELLYKINLANLFNLDEIAKWGEEIANKHNHLLMNINIQANESQCSGNCERRIEKSEVATVSFAGKLENSPDCEKTIMASIKGRAYGATEQLAKQSALIQFYNNLAGQAEDACREQLSSECTAKSMSLDLTSADSFEAQTTNNPSSGPLPWTAEITIQATIQCTGGDNKLIGSKVVVDYSAEVQCLAPDGQ